MTRESRNRNQPKLFMTGWDSQVCQSWDWNSHFLVQIPCGVMIEACFVLFLTSKKKESLEASQEVKVVCFSTAIWTI